MKVEFTEEEGRAFMRIYAVAVAVMAGRFDIAASHRQAILDEGESIQLPARRLMVALATEVDADAAAKATEAVNRDFPGRGWDEYKR
jgi:hypothetical protein